MTRLALLRHARTLWNIEGRLQGRRDISATEEALTALRARKLPAPYDAWAWYASPLTRTRQTAAALGILAEPEPLLIETHWGSYEGQTLGELGTDAAFAENEARGLDFQPPEGESPRQVQARLLPWLKARAAAGEDIGAVTHKGVIRALLAMAYDWPMLGKAPVKLDWSCLQVFELQPDGRPRPHQMNVPLLNR